MLLQDTTHIIQRPCYQREVRAKIQQAIGAHEDLLTIVKRRKLQLYGRVSRSSGLAQTILQGTVKGGRRQGGQRKRWEDNVREWTGLEFGMSQRAVENRENGENWLQNICGTPTTLVVKGLMMMMMMKNVASVQRATQYKMTARRPKMFVLSLVLLLLFFIIMWMVLGPAWISKQVSV